MDFLRPDHLADDHTPIMPVLKFVADGYAELKLAFDELSLLKACAVNYYQEEHAPPSGRWKCP